MQGKVNMVAANTPIARVTDPRPEIASPRHTGQCCRKQAIAFHPPCLTTSNKEETADRIKKVKGRMGIWARATTTAQSHRVNPNSATVGAEQCLQEHRNVSQGTGHVLPDTCAHRRTSASYLRSTALIAQATPTL
jgi:hypothetical protein